MTRFRYVRASFYPDLDLDVTLEVRAHRRDSDYTAYASVKAKGPPGARQRWRDDFWQWAEKRDLDAVAPRYGNRRIDGSSVYDCYLKGWQVTVDFIVMWVGVDSLAEALASRAQLEDRLGAKVGRLADTMQTVVAALARIEKASQQHDRAWESLRSSLTTTPDDGGLV